MNEKKQMKGISICADCAYYSLRKHRCTRGCKDEGEPQERFYRDCPLPDAVPARRGRWIPEADRYNHWHCSECGYVIGVMKMDSLFCLKCGADMEGRENDAEDSAYPPD